MQLIKQQQLYQNIEKVIFESKLSVDIVYFIIKDIERELANLYQTALQEEINNNISKKESDQNED